MYIRREDFIYFEDLFQGLGKTGRDQFVEALAKVVRRRMKERILRIQVVERSSEREDISAKDMISRKMIRDAYKSIKVSGRL